MSSEKKEKPKDEIKVTNFRGSPKVLQISKSNYYYLINREKYDITKIMMMINYNRLSALGHKFRSYPEGIEKIKFSTLLTNLLKTEKMPINELTDLIYGIYRFFSEIDFNGDNNMEWAEFTQFIIDKVEGEHNNMEREQDNSNQIMSEKELMKYKRYELSKIIKDIHIHKTEIISANYINKYNKLLINEYNTHIIKVYNPLNGMIENNINIHEINDQCNNIEFMDIQKQIKYNKKYSVINFSLTEYVIAVLLSNKIIQFFSTFNFRENELIFCLKAKSLQKRIWYLENHNMWISSGDKEVDEDYFYINELDINFEMKSGYPIPLTNYLGYKKRYCKIFQHKDEIYDVIETKKPFLILTACLDGLIRLINVKDAEFLKTWKYHTSGVKHLDYNPNLESNGYILSTGFEYNINLYCTDLSLDSAFKGKLEGHFVPLIDCRFINMTPICASVDEDGNIRIWETQQRICLQSIPNSKKNISINGLIIMGKINKFVTYGNNISFYDAKYKEENENFDNHEENHPIKICFNKYYQQFYVATLNDIQIYDKYGNLDKRFKKLIENEHFDSDTKIRNFIFDSNYRKFYVGFSNGAIIQYNAGNGSAIKIINQIEYEKNGILYYKYFHDKDISSLFFYYLKNAFDEETILLFSSSLDSSIQIYDERDYDNSIKLRMYKGGHTISKRKCEILCIDYNYNLSQLASGSTNGLIVIWDFDNMKIDDTLYVNHKIWGLKIDVLYIKYLNKYPFLFASYSEGICILWSVKPLRGEPILKFQNFYQTLYKLDICDVTCCLFYEDIIKDFEEKYLNKIYFVDEPEFIEERNKPRYDKTNGELLPTLTRELVEKESITDTKYDPFIKENMEIKKNISKEDIINNEEEEKENNKKENPKNEKDNHSYYLLICDKKGFIKVLNLKGIFNYYKKDIMIKRENDSNFNLLKKEDVDVEPTINHLLKNSKVRQKKTFEYPYTNLYTTRIINREWKGHSDYITDVEFIEDPICSVTISKDKFLRIWNEKFELIGEINIIPDENNLNKYIKEKKNDWKFQINEKKLLEKEAHELVYILENIDIKEETKIIKGSQIDKDFNDPEKYEIDEKEGLIKKRIKEKVIEEDKNIKKTNLDLKPYFNENNNKDDNIFQSNYDAILLKNISNKIESIIKNRPQNEGMGEISKNLMASIIESKNKKIKIIKTLNSKLNELNKTNTNTKNDTTDNKKDESRRPSLMSIKKSGFNNSQSNSNLIYINENNQEEDKSQKFTIVKLDNLLKSNFAKNVNVKNRQKESKNLKEKEKEKVFPYKNKTINKINKINNTTKYGDLFNRTKKNTSFKKIKFSNNIKDYARTSKSSINKFNNTFSDISTLIGKKTNPLYKSNYNLNRNTLYAEKFAYKPLYNDEKELKRNCLPNIQSKYFNENIKLNKINLNLNYEVREKTDDLIKTQYYLNNYKNCCRINPNNSDFSTNKSNLFNCKSMWNDIKSFTKDIIQKEEKKKKTLNNFGTLKKFYRSKSLVNIRNGG